MLQQKLDAARWIVSIVFLLGAGVIGGLAVPMWHGKVPPNETYGVRTNRTLADPALWYRANAIVGRNLAVFSVAYALLTMALHFTLARYNFLLSSSLLAGVLLIGTIAIAVHGIRIR
jgi:hypothetical protein